MPSPLGHILCVASNYPRWPGDTTTPFVHNLAMDLMARGWRLTVLAPHAPGCEKAEELDGVPVRRFQYLWPASSQTVCYQGGMLVNLRRRPHDLLKIPCLLWAETGSIMAELRRQRYDLVHSHCIIPQGFTCALALARSPLPHVITVHGSDIFRLTAPVFLPFKRFALRHAAAVTVNSSVTRQAVLDLLPGTANIHLIPMGANLPPSGPRRDPPAALARRFASRRPLLLFVGRLVEEKGVRDLLQAIPLVLAKVPTAHLVLAGEGQDRPDFEKLTATLGIKDSVTFAGWLDTDQLAHYYRAADIFIGPSRPARTGGGEAQGLTFAEAMLSGTPVIATKVGGIVDAVVHEKTGLLVEPHAPAEIAAAILRLWQDQELAARVREEAYRLAKQRFTRQASAAAFSELFREILDRRASR